MPKPLRLTVVAAALVAMLFVADALSWATWHSKPDGGVAAASAPGHGVRPGQQVAQGSSAAASSTRAATGTTKGRSHQGRSSLTGVGSTGHAKSPVSVSGVSSSGQTSTTTGAAAGGTVPNATGGTGVPAPPEWGTYQINQSGSFTSSIGKPYTYPPVGTLVVNQADTDGRQLWQRYVQSGSQPSDTTLQYGPNGPHILSMSEAGSPCTFPAPGVPAPPWPLAPGETATADGQCGSGSNTFRLHLVEQVKGTQSYRLPDGAALPVWLIDTAITITGSNYKATGTQVDYYSAGYRLPIEEDVNITGTYDGVIHFALNSKSVLQSTTPTQS